MRIGMAILFVLGGWAGIWAQYQSGDGSVENPFKIATAGQMDAIGQNPQDWNKHFILVTDIDLVGYDGQDGRPAFHLIGLGGQEDPAFSGSFDGAGHTISHFCYTSDAAVNTGCALFARVSDPCGLICNLTLVDAVIHTPNSDILAALIGSLDQGLLRNCSVVNATVVGKTKTGAAIGWAGDSIIEYICVENADVSCTDDRGGALLGSGPRNMISHCSTSGVVSGQERVGGLIGSCNETNIVACHSHAQVLCEGSQAGGLIGVAYDSCMIDTCTASGYVMGDEQAGGLVGLSLASHLFLSHATGIVTGDDQMGGLIGQSSGDTLVECSASGDIWGRNEVGGLIGRGIASLQECSASGTVVGKDDVGGLVGRFYGPENWGIDALVYPADIYQSQATGNVFGDFQVGGLLGTAGNLDLAESFASGDVVGMIGLGGLIGGCSSCAIEDCYAQGNVLGDTEGGSEIGGLLGWAELRSLSRCYATGFLLGDSDETGGVIGHFDGDPTNINACFWDMQTSGQSTGIGSMPSGLSGVQGRSTGQMQTMETYTAAPYNWDFAGEIINGSQDTWLLVPGHYPQLNRTTLMHGDGSYANPYQIATADQLDLIGQMPTLWNKHFVLVADIDLSDYDGREDHAEFHLIGYGNEADPAFSGSFNGNGHSISHFCHSSHSEDDNGRALFARVSDPCGLICNLTLVSPEVTALNCERVGALVGSLDSGHVHNCTIVGGQIRGQRKVGGAIGWVGDSVIEGVCVDSANVAALDNRAGGLYGSGPRNLIVRCTSSGIINTPDRAGGLIGSCDETNVANCNSTAMVNCEQTIAGALIGKCYAHCLVEDCIGEGIVHGIDKVGGLIGLSMDSVVVNCQAKGYVDGRDEVGGLVGMAEETSFAGCSASNGVTGEDYVGGVVGTCEKGLIRNTQASGTVIGYDWVGGMAGRMIGEESLLYPLDSTPSWHLYQCSASGVVFAEEFVGGLIGSASLLNIAQCHAHGDVLGFDDIGGLIGALNRSSVVDCYARGNVLGDYFGHTSTHVGGLIGQASSGELSHCYATGFISGQAESVGGLLGSITPLTAYPFGSLDPNSNEIANDNWYEWPIVGDLDIVGCFWNIMTSGQNAGIGVGAEGDEDVSGLSTEEMQTMAIFTAGASGWDFAGEIGNGTEHVWRMCHDGIDFPILSWEHAGSDFDCPDGVGIEDFAYFAEYGWQLACDDWPCGRCDLDSSNVVDIADLVLFVDNWLMK